jgi:hypothetical protein
MTKRKLVVLKPDPNDARAKIVTYHPRGQEIGRVTMAALERIDAVIEERVGRRALQELRRALLNSDWGPPVTATADELDSTTKKARPAVEEVVRHRKKAFARARKPKKA